ncbi:kallikrein-4-like isoform X2 [Plodia interpunctella]|uniref:kallikrein-4-like isoform X2 n=1 Tax=Plodia interpunctella TaxID=58824 RepID=UPI0023689DAA|nr:kallikrein-4-like isoform X2 [Plodia interpunctella]
MCIAICVYVVVYAESLIRGSYQYITSLRNSMLEQICGSTIISPHFALTAAHCVHDHTAQYSLSLNNYCLVPDDSYPQAQVLDIITHPQYDKVSNAHDISILRIDLNFSDVSWINDAILPTSSFGITGECSIYGYGYRDDKQISDTLVAANVGIMSLDRCATLLGPYVAPSHDSGMICAFGGKSDGCQGDSGGPLICDGKLQGLSSYGVDCGLAGAPGVYVSTGAHLQWIRNITNLH